MKLPITVPKAFRIIAHRGASGYAPENTLAAFRLAEKMGIREIELDIWLCKDNHIVICHDGILDRYGYPGQHVKDLDLDDILKLDMGSWFSPYFFSGEQMLTLETLFAQFRDRFIYHVEIKEPQPGLARKVLTMVNNYSLEKQVIITSFHMDTLIKVKTRAPMIRTGWLLKKGLFIEEYMTQASDAGFFQICPSAQDTNKAMVEAAHTKLSEVRAWGISTVELALQAIQSKCDGFTINWPDWFVHEFDG